MQGAMLVSDTQFDSRSSLLLPERILHGAAGFFCLLPLWAFFIRLDGNPFQIGLLPFRIIALGGMAVGLPVLASPLLGGEGAVRLHREAGLLTVITRSPLFSRTQSWCFERYSERQSFF